MEFKVLEFERVGAMFLAVAGPLLAAWMWPDHVDSLGVIYAVSFSAALIHDKLCRILMALLSQRQDDFSA